LRTYEEEEDEDEEDEEEDEDGGREPRIIRHGPAIIERDNEESVRKARLFVP
jgi:hypothetical protein